MTERTRKIEEAVHDYDCPASEWHFEECTCVEPRVQTVTVCAKCGSSRYLKIYPTREGGKERACSRHRCRFYFMSTYAKLFTTAARGMSSSAVRYFVKPLIPEIDLPPLLREELAEFLAGHPGISDLRRRTILVAVRTGNPRINENDPRLDDPRMNGTDPEAQNRYLQEEIERHAAQTDTDESD